MKRVIVGSPEAMSKEPCLEHPDYIPKTHTKSCRERENEKISQHCYSLHEETMRSFFSRRRT